MSKMGMLFRSSRMIITSVVIAVLVFLFSKDFGMFWDNVLFASKMGNQLYHNSLFNWQMPDSFDPGHPPFLGFLLALTWKFFGQSLWVSHLLMLPFVIGCLYQLQVFIQFFVKDHRWVFWGFLLVICDPTFSTAMVLVNPEVIILFFFFLAINGLLKNNSRQQFLGLLFLSIISFRSMMLFGGILLFEVLQGDFLLKKKWKQIISFRLILIYFFAAIPGIVFVSWRLLTKGWLQTHPDSPWQSLWEFVSLQELLRNCLVLVWRYLDFGRVFIVLFLIIGVVYFRSSVIRNQKFKQLILLSQCSVVFIVIISLLSTNAFGHRYFIAAYLCITLLAFSLILELKKYKKLIYSLLLAGLITGNFWIYPERISQGWDASLAHVPYHELRKEAIKYLDTMGVDFQKVATFFPNYNTIDEIELNGDQRKLSRFNSGANHVFYSNVYNLSDLEYDDLEKHFVEIKRFEKRGIYISILKRK